MIKIVKNKHQSLVDKLFGHYVIKIKHGTVSKNELYPLGELDVHINRLFCETYIEVKSNCNEHNLKKAKQQLLRWTSYRLRRDPTKNYYGYYYSPQHKEMLCINGKLRK